MVDKISQNLKYSNNAGVMCRKGSLSVARLGEDAEKYIFAMQLSDYQAFTPPPPPNSLIINELRTFGEQLKNKNIQFKIINRLIHDFNKIYLIFKILYHWKSCLSYLFCNLILIKIFNNLNHFKTMVANQKFITEVIGDNRLHKDAAQTMGRIPCKNSKHSPKCLKIVGSNNFKRSV